MCGIRQSAECLGNVGNPHIACFHQAIPGMPRQCGESAHCLKEFRQCAELYVIRLRKKIKIILFTFLTKTTSTKHSITRKNNFNGIK